MVVFVPLVCVVLLLFTSCSYAADEDGSTFLKSYLEVLEKSLKHEVRPDSGEIEQIIQRFSNLNSTIEQIIQSVSNLNSTIQYLYDFDHSDNRFTKILTTAFRNEKIWVGKMLDTINNDLVNIQEQIKQSKANEISNIEREVKNIKTEIMHQFQALSTKVEQYRKRRVRTGKKVREMKIELVSLRRDMLENLQIQNNTIKDICNEIHQTSKTMMSTTTRSDSEADSQPVVPDQPRRKTCPRDWDEYNKFCYIYCDRSEYQSDAKGYCRGEGAYLVDITSQQEEMFVNTLVPVVWGSSRPVFIGLEKRGEDYEWAWLRTGDVARYTNWEPGEPEHPGSGYCVLSFIRGGNSSWHTSECHGFAAFICKKAL